jgi:hypothetical protein
MGLIITATTTAMTAGIAATITATTATTVGIAATTTAIGSDALFARSVPPQHIYSKKL